MWRGRGYFFQKPVNRSIFVRFQNRNHQNVRKSICLLSSHKKSCSMQKKGYKNSIKSFFMIFSAKKSFYPPPTPPLTNMKIIFLVLGLKYLKFWTKLLFRFWNRTKIDRLTDFWKKYPRPRHKSDFRRQEVVMLPSFIALDYHIFFI